MKEVTKASKRKICYSEEMKWDISELCDECPLIESTNVYIRNRVIPGVEEYKSALPPDLFKEKLTEDIKHHLKEKEKIRDSADRNSNRKWDPNRHERIMLYVLHTEVIKFKKSEIQKVEINNPKKVSSTPFKELFKEPDTATTVIDKLLKAGLIIKGDDKKNYWATKKNLIVILAEWCKQKRFLKETFSGYKTQKELSDSLCYEFNVDKPKSIYQTFKGSELLVNEDKLFDKYQKKVEELNVLLEPLPKVT